MEIKADYHSNKRSINCWVFVKKKIKESKINLRKSLGQKDKSLI